MTHFLLHSNIEVPEGVWYSLKSESDSAVLVIYEKGNLSD